MEDVTIRAATPDDAHDLTRVAHAAKRHWGYPDALIELWRNDLTLTAQFIRTHPVYCAAAGSQILGFYALSRAQAAFELEHMWVDPPHMGRGVGRQLFQHAVDTVRALGGTSLTIAADPNAEAFYQRLGARRVGAVPSQPPGRELPLLVITVRGAR